MASVLQSDMPSAIGGPLADLNGRVIGITIGGSGSGLDIVGYAVPITTGLAVTTQIADGNSQRPEGWPARAATVTREQSRFTPSSSGGHTAYSLSCNTCFKIKAIGRRAPTFAAGKSNSYYKPQVRVLT